MKLEEAIHNSTGRTVFEYSEIMNRQSNLVFININENRSSLTCIQRQALAKYLLNIFRLLHIPNHFPNIKRFQRVGKKSVVELSTMKARE